MSSDSTSLSALEQFRQQWQEEVIARQRQGKRATGRHSQRKSSTEDGAGPERPINRPSERHSLADKDDEDDVIPESSSAPGALAEKIDAFQISGDADEDEFSRLGKSEPTTALEHYERAVEKESQGKLGDSLSHYRKAFKLDDSVDQLYKQKHFAHKWKLAKPNPSNATPTVPSTAHHSQPEAGIESVPQTTAQLVASFADCGIQGIHPMIPGDIPPPCPISKLPTEVLLELLQHIAQKDVSIYARLASVCKKLAYHVYTESSIWKRVALGPEFGFASQQYHFNTDIQGRPIIWQALEDDEIEEDALTPAIESIFPPDSDWREVFHSYPRIRFSGVYISTVNYTRQGGASVTPAAWGQQVHIVTYYRYLRFFRDGTLISLLTTHEPIEVVQLLTKENLAIVRSTSHKNVTTAAQPIITPSAQNILKHALRGRWRLCHPSLDSIEVGSNLAIPGDIHIETEGGAGPRYMYTMHLSLKNGNTRNQSAPRNNKLVWKGFWSYNSITADWAPFQLRNDKAFWFSRVKSYGLGY